MAFTEFFTNFGSCSLTAGYTAADSSITVSSTTGDSANYPFPVSAPFRLSLWDTSDPTNPVFKVLLKVTAITDGTHFAVTAEGHDANAASGSTCYGVITAAALTAIRTDAGTDANLTLTDITTNNVSTSKHGFAPKAPNDATKFLDGTGAYSVPSGSAGALVLLEQHTASTSASLDFSAWYSSSYDEYMIEFVNIIPATNNVDFWIRMAGDSGTNYGWNSYRFATDGAAQAGANSGQTKIVLNGTGISNSSTYGLCGSLKLFSPGSTALYKTLLGQISHLDTQGTPHIIQDLVYGVYLSTSAITTFSGLCSSGNIASGTIRIYGIAK